MSAAERAVALMESWAEDPAHGYDQTYRWGERGDYDCSAAVISAWEAAGVPVKTAGATYTGNMRSTFLSCGFRDVTNAVNLDTGAGLQRGDVLLNYLHHTAMYCGGGYEVEASTNENGGTTGGKPGDQTGREFLKRTYRNYPWNCVLRYVGAGQAETEGTEQKEPGKFTLEFRTLVYGMTGEDVRAMQRLLKAAGFDIGKYGADGDFGYDTKNAVKAYQRSKQIEVDGEAGPETRARLYGTK